MSDRADIINSELVLGFVGPVGVDTSRFYNAAMARLRAFGYHPVLVKLSEKLDDLKNKGLLKTELISEPEFERMRSHMDAGDELRGLPPPGARGLLASAAVAQIASLRKRNAEGQTKPSPRCAWLISSLKNPAEAEVLRRVYGAGFFLVGLFATEAERKKSLQRGMTPEEAQTLIVRDAESEDKHGQQTRKTFELADAWVTDEDQLCRFLDLIFGNPFQTPTDDEDGMALAYAAALRSSDLSRQVGAAIVAETGEVLATGRNEVPAPGGGQYSPPTKERPSARDCDVGEDSNTKERLRIEGEIEALVEEHVLAEFKDLEDVLEDNAKKLMTERLARIRTIVSGALPRTGLRDITEYGRAVHAEMSALMSAVRIGVAVRGATLYCTTFPCHTCAKHLAAAGISRVVFVEPYPKSKARDLHSDAIELVGESSDENRKSELTAGMSSRRTRFEPFLGIGPRRYFDLFSLRLGAGRSLERKNGAGDVLTFDLKAASPRVPLATTTYLEEEIAVAGAIEDLEG